VNAAGAGNPGCLRITEKYAIDALSKVNSLMCAGLLNLLQSRRCRQCGLPPPPIDNSRRHRGAHFHATRINQMLRYLCFNSHPK
jgi:hypothetical protein